MHACMHACMRLGNPVRFRNWNDVLDNRSSFCTCGPLNLNM